MKTKFIFLIFLVLIFFGCKKYHKIEGNSHAPYEITYQSNSPEKVERLIRHEFERYYHSINSFDSLSIISYVNQNKDVEVDSVFINTFNKSIEISRLSDGMFDVTCAPLLNLWGFGFTRADSVTPKVIDSLLSFVGYEKVRLEDKIIIKEDPRILLNFSGLGDGCICDMIADSFDKMGINNYLIQIGGEVTAKGHNPKGRPWRLGIIKPIDDNFSFQQELIEQKLQIQERMGIATSGDYRNYYIKDGKKYAHTLNPKTGYPAGQNILSATVLAKECLVADGLATAIMSMGTEGIKTLEDKIPDLKYYIIYSDRNGDTQIKYSKEMEKYFSPESRNTNHK